MNKITTLIASTALTAFVVGYDNEAGWKKDDDGNLVVGDDGNPIWINSSGGEQVVKGDTISRLNGEAQAHRQAKEKAEDDLKKFEGIDPDAARQAIATVADIDAKKLIDKGELDTVKQQIEGQYKEQIETLTKERDTARTQLDRSVLDRHFATSEFITEKIDIPVDMFQNTFSRHFEVVDGEIVAKDANGNTIYSNKDMGNPASFDEALQLIVEAYPHKDRILKAPDASGTGNNGNGGNSNPRGRTITRDELKAKTPFEQQKIAQQVQAGEMKLVD